MIGKAEIAEIVRNNDAISEERLDQPGFWRERGVDIHALMHVASQRGMRVVMRDKGMKAHPTRQMAVRFTSSEKAQLVKYAGMFFDGFAAGLEAGRRYPKEQA